MSNRTYPQRMGHTSRRTAKPNLQSRLRRSPLPRGGRPVDQSRGLTERIVWRPIGELRPFPGSPRRHPESQIASLMRSIQRVWANPILIDEATTILAGHGHVEAAARLTMAEGRCCVGGPGAFPAFVPRNDIWPEEIRAWPF
jgi:hypothetical protein